MKKLYPLLLVAIAFMGCDQQAQVNTVDNRPKKELDLIKQLSIADSVTSAQINDVNKKDAVDSGKVKISNFIINKLDSKVENWPAVIYEITTNFAIEIKLMIPMGKELDEKYPQYSSIILDSKSFTDDAKIKTLLKPLQPKDEVLVTGTFEKNIDGIIDFDSNMNAPGHSFMFSNPLFNFIITDIKKK